MKVIAVVPMKLNNMRLPNKNIKCFTNGKPLCHYILSMLLSVECIDEVYVYCSSPEIKKFLPQGIHYKERSPLLDQDKTKMNEVLKEFVKEEDADIYVMTHVTSPFVKKASIEAGIDAVINGDYDSSFAVHRIQEFLWDKNKLINYELDNIPRTQDLPVLYAETSGFYIYRKEVMSQGGRRIGVKPFLVEVDKIEAIDIDEEEDFIIADAIYNHLFGTQDT